MTLKYAKELQYLNHYYEKEESQIVVVYGQKNLGMADMVRDFCHGKPFSYYRARPCSEREQLFQWGKERKEDGAFLSSYPSYADIFASVVEKQSRKKIMVIDEFQNIVKVGSRFMKELTLFIHNQRESQSVMVILCSSSIGWVENSMVQKIGETAYEISGFIKIKERGFWDMARRFPECSMEQQIELYAVLGGFPELWEHFDDGAGIKENVCRHILPKAEFLHEEALRLVAGELRETNVYHSILTALAGGNRKLNDLYLRTGFSRAKISVYLKNLMELEIVEKVFSYDTAGKENTQKGIYRIANHLVHFYFRYLYPNLSRLGMIPEEEFYERYIAPTFRAYTAPYFGRVCAQYMERLNDKKLLPFVYERDGEWVGKAGNIDMVAQDGNHTLICLSNWEKPVMLYEDYEWLMFCTQKAKVKPDYIYLFSASRFDERLILEAKVKNTLKLLDLNEL